MTFSPDFRYEEEGDDGGGEEDEDEDKDADKKTCVVNGVANVRTPVTLSWCERSLISSLLSSSSIGWFCG